MMRYKEGAISCLECLLENLVKVYAILVNKTVIRCINSGALQGKQNIVNLYLDAKT